MNPKRAKCPMLSSSAPAQSRTKSNFSRSTVHDSAALLLSIADIAKSELDTTGFSMLWDYEEDRSTKQHPLLLPAFPILRTKNAVGAISPTHVSGHAPRSSRARSVSVDTYDGNKTSRTVTKASLPNRVSPYHRKHSLRLATRTKPEYFSDSSESSSAVATRPRSVSFDPSPKKSKSLQGTPPSGVEIQKIYRKKFSWKNYPELEQFLVANREEYLKHSALNYTIQQKQYNNRLTENLLELATAHGYMFNTTDFGFVTVRDRIRCYFKSYVQSAKKRGVLMGYAARKAGLLNAKDLQQQTNGEIFTP